MGGYLVKTEIIPKVITLLAGAIVSIVCIINGVDVTRSLEFLLATLRLSCEKTDTECTYQQ